MSAAFTGIILSLIAVLSSARALSPAELENRLWTLHKQVEEHKTAKDWAAATGVIREMAALDPQHPKVYQDIVSLQSRRGSLADTPAVMDSLGLRSGPGRDYGQALLSFFQKHPAEALPMLSRALKAYETAGHVAGQAACHAAFAIAAKNEMKLDEAVSQYEAALRLVERIGDMQGMAGLLHELADVEIRRGRPDLALQRQQQLLPIREAQGDLEGQAKSWHAIGMAYRDMRDPDKALEAFQRALAIRRQTHYREGEITNLSAIASLRSASGDYDRALVDLEEALKVAAAIPDDRAQADVLRQKGDTLFQAGRYRDVVEPLEGAAALFTRLEDGSGEARALSQLGSAHHGMGDLQKARTILQRSIERARAVKDRFAEATALGGQANVSLAVGDLTQALLDQERAFILFRETKDRPEELRSENNLAAIYFSLGDLGRSRRYLEKALEGYEELGDRRGVARTRTNLGVLLSEKGQLKEALDQLRKALDGWAHLDDRRGAAITRSVEAETLFLTGRREEALRSLSGALQGLRETRDLPDEAYALNLLGEIELASGRPDNALKSHRRALEISNAARLPYGQWRAHAGLASVMEAKGRIPRALEEDLLAIDLIEGVRGGLLTGEFKMLFLAGKIRLYEHALARLIPRPSTQASKQAVAASFNLCERARARSLLDLLSEARSSLRQKLPPELLRREEDILDDLSGAAIRLAGSESGPGRAETLRQLDQARERLERLEIEVRQWAPRDGSILYPRAASLADIQGTVLRDVELLLEYFVGQQRAWLWAVDTKGATLHDLGRASEISNRVSSFLKEAGAAASDLAGRQRDIAASERLAATILPPSVLRPRSRILVVPDGPLHSVPFEALRIGGRFLVETHEIVVLPSATVLGLMRTQPSPVASGGFLGVGDPVLADNGKALPPLPFSRQELESVAALFPEGRGKILSGAEATKAAVRSAGLDQFRFIHFATHGWIDEENPRHSGLRLSPPKAGEPADLLYTDEILALPLASEIVVLSSCRSGAGEVVAGEGLVGLTRAFLYAGSRTVLVSLWNVSDRSTTAFMQAFYRRLLEGETPAASLRHAKLESLTSDQAGRRRLFQWAPFTLVGDSNN